MAIDFSQLWASLFWPLGRLLMGMAAGLFFASILESLQWTNYLAKLARPLSHAARLNPLSATAFALAIISPSSSNAFLAEKHEKGLISSRDLILTNIFNSLPANLMHLPNIFFLMWPVLGTAALIYAGISLAAAIGRSIFAIILSRYLFAKSNSFHLFSELPQKKEKFFPALKQSLPRAWRRFRKRLPRLIYFTVPFYLLIFFMNQSGYFTIMEQWLATNFAWPDFIKAQALSIILLQLVAEFGASLGAAGALLETGGLDSKDIVLALLAGNILSTPIRSIRHQLPVYAGFYKPILAMKLIMANQSLRAASMLIGLLIYAYL